MKSVIRKLAIMFLVIVVFASIAHAKTFSGKTWPTSSGEAFPYVGALFCHDGDYVKFHCTQEHHRFYYMTRDDKTAYIEFYIDGKGTGVPTAIRNKWDREPFSSANWRHFDLGQGYIGHVVDIRLIENRTVNRQYCPEADIMIKLQDNSQAIRWRHVDSTSWCDLDQVGY
ncbi:MAG: hypothetical protein NUW23_14860 [Firmicutes bacterium]|jgi:hypothetical protein|nr:hypothetical protein [Bacillota bacterium]